MLAGSDRNTSTQLEQLLAVPLGCSLDILQVIDTGSHRLVIAKVLGIIGRIPAGPISNAIFTSSSSVPSIMYSATNFST